MKKSMGNVARKLRYVIGACTLLTLFLYFGDTTVKADYYTDEETGIRYAYNEDATTPEEQIAIVYSYSGDATEILIPSSIEVEGITYKVIGIGRMTALPIANQYSDFAEVISEAVGFAENTTITSLSYASPANIEYIGFNSFDGCSALTGEAPLPSGLKYIGNCAFQSCNGLDAMHIPEGVLKIGSWAFQNCSSISEYSIPDSVQSIGISAFENCESLSGSFEIPMDVTEIPEYMLRGCKSITEIILHDNVTQIGKSAFAGCSSLSGTFKVPENVKEIPDGMLANDELLTAIELHNGITKIGTAAFLGNKGLKTFTVPSSVTRIEPQTFQGCTGLEEIVIHDNVTYLGFRAFENCYNLTGSIKVPDEMTEIPTYLFYNCKKLSEIILPDNLSSIGLNAFYGCESWEGEIPSLASANTIGSYAFMNCKLLTGTPVLSDELIKVSMYAFYGCSSLTGELVIPGNVASIGEGAFSNCANITGLTIENGVEKIGQAAFHGCEGLGETALYIPESVTSVGANAFLNYYSSGYSSGRYICNIYIFYPQDKHFDEYDNAICIVSYKGEADGMLSLHVERRYLYYEISETWTNELKVPEKIFGKTVCKLTKVDDSYLYEDMGGYMTDLIIVDEAHYFNDWDQVAVANHGRNCTICGNLFTEAHKYPNGNSACSECGHVPFTLAGSLSQKGAQTGYTSGAVCTVKAVCKLSGEALTYQWYENGKAISKATSASYTIPTGKSAGTYTYTCKVSNGAYSATSTAVTFTVYKPEVVDGIKLIDPSLEPPKAGDYVKSSDGKSVYKVSVASGKYEVEYSRPVNKNLTAVVIPDTVTIGGVKYSVTSIADNAFKNCKKLKTLKIGNKVKKIGAKAFYGCKSLTKVTGGKALLTIGKSAFQSCSKLKTVSITSKKLKKIGAKAFYGCRKLTKITLKTTKLTKKSVGKNALKKTSSKLVIKVPKKKVSVYKKYFKGKGNNKTVVKK